MRPRRMRTSRPLSVESLETRLALSGFAMRAPSLSHDLGRDEGLPTPFDRSSEHGPVAQSPYTVVPTANRGEPGSRGELGPCCARSPERSLELAGKPLVPSDLSPDRSSPFGSPSFNPSFGLGAAGGLDRGEGEPTYVTQVIIFIARPIQGGGLSDGSTDGIPSRPNGGAGAAELGNIIGSVVGGSVVGGSEPVRSGLANSGLESGSSFKSETPAFPSGERTSTAAASFWASQLAGTWSDAWRSTASDADDSTFTRYALNAANGISWDAVTRGAGTDTYAATVDGILARAGGIENADADGFIELQPNQGDVAAESEGTTVQVPGLSRRGGTSDRLSNAARWSSWETRGVGRAVLGNASHGADTTLTEAGQLAGLMANGGELPEAAASADGMIELAHRGLGAGGPAAFHLGSPVDATLALVRVDALRAQHQSFDVGVVNGQPLPATPPSSQELAPTSAAAVNHSLSSPEAIGEAAGTSDRPGDSAASWWSTMFLMAAGTAILIRNPASTGRAGWRGTRRWAIAARGWVRRQWRNLQRSV